MFSFTYPSFNPVYKLRPKMLKNNQQFPSVNAFFFTSVHALLFALKNSSPPFKKLGEKGGGITRRGRINSQRKRGTAELGLQIEGGGRQCNELLRSGSSCHGSPTYTLIGHRTRVANQIPRQSARQTEICVFLKRCAAVFWFTLFVSQIDSWVSELGGVGC